jgi:exonuclease SbcC
MEACEGADEESISSELRSAEAESTRLSGEIESIEARMAEATRQEASLESSIKAEEDAESREMRALEEKSEELKAMMDSSGIDEEGLSRLSGIDRDSLESEISLYDDAVRSNDALIEDLESRVEGREKPDLEAATASVESSKESLGVERSRLSIVSARLERNMDALGRIKDALPRWRVLKTEAADLRLLSDAASGKVQGGVKVPFDQYIQTVYFDSILGLANRRLKSMSGGRYELVRKTDGDNRGQHALDIDVMDNYTGIQRSVRTLSGGESFKAALSLALGLSDMVQYTAGGLRVETLFIDEGFGSLDSDSLEQAIAVLESLSEGDVMVGVISHVDLFKERMSKKICVSKKKNGGSFVEIVTD